MLKKILTSFIALPLILLFPVAVSAVTAPSFPTCSNPQGSLIVQYDSGVHGVIGDSTTYTGKDSVYQTSDDTLIQCLCSDNGQGIQTNWWKVSSLSRDQIESLKSDGWYFIPNGADWGLADASYLASNTAFSCGGGNPPGNPPGNPGGGGETPVCNAEKPNAPVLLNVVRKGMQATLTWSKVDKASHYTIAYGTKVGDYPYGVFDTGNVTTYTINSLDPNTQYYFVVYAVNDCMPSNSSAGGIGGGQVLGLASTGGALTVLAMALTGIATLTGGLLLKRTSKAR